MSWRMVDYDCPECGGRSESLEDSRTIPETLECGYCGGSATKVFPSPGMVKVDYGCVRGRTEKHPPWALLTDPEVPVEKREEHNRRRKMLFHQKEKQELGFTR